MPDHLAISVERVSKEYQLGTINHGTLHRDLQSWWARVRGRPDPNAIIRDEQGVSASSEMPSVTQVQSSSNERFLALDDVSFEVRKGETFGIIGKNGAGKSTLLKILCRVTAPTSGRARIRGRIASLLEVGTGFHPELTGRENVFLNGAILGMTRAEIRRNFDDIVDFSQLSRFIDTPVKRYSSGMYVRLAFAVAAHLDAEVMIVDEVLAVGDYEFQKKCMEKLRSVTAQGRTVLLVSHNMTVVQALCSRAILLRQGRLTDFGETAEVLQAYLTPKKADATQRAVSITPGKAKFTDWWVEAASKKSSLHSCYSKEMCSIRLRIESAISAPDAYVGVALWNADGVLIFGASTQDHRAPLKLEPGAFELEMTLRLPLKNGVYNLELSLNSHVYGQLDRWASDQPLLVLPSRQSTLPERWRGLLDEDVTFRFFKQEAIGLVEEVLTSGGATLALRPAQPGQP
jgi:lipopolysaccharide transport system ATP-binding protein